MIKNIVFDFGGVIADISRDNAVQAFRQLGLTDADTRLDKYHQTGIFQELEEGKLSKEAFKEQLETLCHKPLTEEDVRQAWLGFITGVDTRKLDYLEELRRKGFRLYVLSNTNPFVMSWAESADFSPQGNPLSHYMDHLYLSYQIGYTKPDRRIFCYMLEHSHIRQEETLFVDDGSSNIAAGKELGMHTFQPKNGEDWRSMLDALITSLNMEKKSD